MDNPKISVIVPVYNAEACLRKCVDSILSQTFSNLELLLIDDGSKDKSGEICDEYARLDNRVHVFHKENGGVSSARNLGIEEARGEWISFVDSDDYVSGEYFPSNHLGGNVDLILNKISHTPYCDAENECKNINTSLFLQKILNTQISLGPWAKFFRKVIIDEVHLRYYEDIKFAEDAIFNLQYFKYVKILAVNNNGVYHYIAPPASAMWHKYGMTFDMLESYSSRLLEAYYNLNITNHSMENTMFYSFVIFADILSVSKEDYKRKKKFLRNSLMKELERRAFKSFRLFKYVYVSNKYLPYYLDKLITNMYLRKNKLNKIYG